ncbi:MAG: hypothetical protein ACFE85_16725 [Candidatus Hodarchaeota archaeon]
MSEEREELRCCILIIGLVALIALSTVILPYIVSFIALLIYGWYLSIPGMIGLGFLINYLFKKKQIRDAYRTINTPPYQTKFEAETGKKALVDNKVTKEYKEWLVKIVKPSRPQRRFTIPFRDIKGFLMVVAFIILLTALYLWIYSLIFPDFRVAIAPEQQISIPGYETFLIISIIFAFGGIYILKTIRNSKFK